MVRETTALGIWISSRDVPGVLREWRGSRLHLGTLQAFYSWKGEVDRRRNTRG